MTDIPTIAPDVERLGSHLDRLEDALEPLLGNLSEMASQLPLLDRAKLFSLTAYAIESLLFSSLKVQGADAQNHAVYAELKRIQQYFAKIKAAEEPEAKRTLTVNQEAAARILKADLSDNKTLSARLAEKIAEERAKALLKATESKKRAAEEVAPQPTGSASSGPSGQSKKARTKGKGKARK
ncbi:exosome-associated family [Trichoderma arundinaceum]|uniref:Exosome complex protein n=1 Tax=Trichoderma arundinaceum TaxID=490622 RepID=A0A395NNF1_TRIAR|nr:exosome-associated family [Trichoderma arundinaceum]